MRTQHILATLALALPAFVSASSAYTKLGCYSDVPDLKGDSTNSYQAYGACLNSCSKGGYKIAVLSKGNHCACSNAVPPDSAKVSDDKCNTACPGYPTDYCGGDDVYMVLSTGQYVVSESDGGAATTPTAATAAGGIIVAATNVNPTTVPTSILTAPGAMITKAGVSGEASSSAAATAASSSASASPTSNAAVSLRGGSSMAGLLVAGLGLLL
ncbi:uncharacterized protein N7458_001427 [Penicillium daleae]|uniref:WSC domain-containing protein n=1 Tax=Penicillium daleae TaxID=63821 RepID=A0AAD6CDG9_9EURO|nr:uncharacterized protein N7458_001427 [Penicillium daleae]KAJ5459875.1 hypothetical protein N7458_001427 [Penicillium daleae]